MAYRLKTQWNGLGRVIDGRRGEVVDPAAGTAAAWSPRSAFTLDVGSTARTSMPAVEALFNQAERDAAAQAAAASTAAGAGARPWLLWVGVAAAAAGILWFVARKG